ncbi:uncharacterized protein A4U43_C02F4030 [Asparagus officinalis]|uniref:Uncharacterized protein n=1 Tax=Asparagus officinalis TaxID=4686 RepID=A0A5P1FKI9_ASPOF|nr:uncharacterized protein A4U43_C02F4030 [Asparagus officinalis]
MFPLDELTHPENLSMTCPSTDDFPTNSLQSACLFKLTRHFGTIDLASPTLHSLRVPTRSIQRCKFAVTSPCGAPLLTRQPRTACSRSVGDVPHELVLCRCRRTGSRTIASPMTGAQRTVFIEPAYNHGNGTTAPAYFRRLQARTRLSRTLRWPPGRRGAAAAFAYHARSLGVVGP